MALFRKKDEQAEQDKEHMLQDPTSKNSKSSFNRAKFGESLRNINPTKHVHKLKGSMRWMLWIMKKVKKRGVAFPLFMIVVNTLYLVLGGLLFMFLERQPTVKISTPKELAELFDVLKVS
jgi:hypothetical protein